jgi:DNA-binding NtrC family response regulator
VPAPRFSSALLDACQHYSWPGNLWELQNFVKRFLALGDDGAAVESLCPDCKAEPVGPRQSANDSKINAPWAGNARTADLKSLVRNASRKAERQAIAQALEETKWNRKAAARALGISYRGLLYKIQRYHMSVSTPSTSTTGST